MPPAAYLPTDLPNPPTYNKVNPADTPILTLAITSDTLPLEKVNDFADTVLAQKLSEVTGVGLVTIEGNQKPAVRVQVNPAAIASLGLSLEDIRTAFLPGNVNAPKGSFDGPQQSYSIGANDQIFSADDYSQSSSPTKTARPCGSATSATSSTTWRTCGSPPGSGRSRQEPAVLLDIQRQPGANIIQTADRVKAVAARNCAPRFRPRLRSRS